MMHNRSTHVRFRNSPRESHDCIPSHCRVDASCSRMMTSQRMRRVIGPRDAPRSIPERKGIDFGENIALENAAFRAVALLLRSILSRISGTWNATYISPRPEVDGDQRCSRLRSSAYERQPKCSKAKVKVEHRRRKSMTRSSTPRRSSDRIEHVKPVMIPRRQGSTFK